MGVESLEAKYGDDVCVVLGRSRVVDVVMMGMFDDRGVNEW